MTYEDQTNEMGIVEPTQSVRESRVFGALEENAGEIRGEAKFSQTYLGNLANIRTPSSIDVDDHNTFRDYCELRNYAKDLLRDEKDEVAMEGLSHLVAKLGIGVLN